MKMKKLMSGILAATILITSASVSTFADEVETTEATEEVIDEEAIETESIEESLVEETTEETIETEATEEATETESTEEVTEETESVEFTEAEEEIDETEAIETEESTEESLVEEIEESLVEETEEATEESTEETIDETESTEEATEEAVEETESVEEATEAVETKEILVAEESLVEETEETESLVEETTEETESIEESLVEETEESLAEETESTETEVAEETEEVIESTEETETINTEDFIAADFSTEEVSLVSTDAVSSFSEEVTDDVKESNHKTVGAEKLVIGKTYSLTLKGNEHYLLYGIPSSTKKDTYYALLEVTNDGNASADFREGKFTNREDFNAADSKCACNSLIVCSDDENKHPGAELRKVGGECTAKISNSYSADVTLNFTVVRIPSEAVDESKLNVIPDAKGNLTYVWEPTSDCDGMNIFGTNPGETVFDVYCDPSKKSYTTTTYVSCLNVTPYVLAGDIPVYANDCHVSIGNHVEPITLKTPDTPKVTIKDRKLTIEKQKTQGLGNGMIMYDIYDSNNKLLDTVLDCDVWEEDPADGKDLSKYAGQTLSVVARYECTAICANGDWITLSSDPSKSVSFTVEGVAKPSLSVEANDSKGIHLRFETNRIYEYLIYRSTSKNGEYKKVGTTLDDWWSDSNVTSGKTYYYKVKGCCGQAFL